MSGFVPAVAELKASGANGRHTLAILLLIMVRIAGRVLPRGLLLMCLKHLLEEVAAKLCASGCCKDSQDQGQEAEACHADEFVMTLCNEDWGSEQYLKQRPIEQLFIPMGFCAKQHENENESLASAVSLQLSRAFCSCAYFSNYKFTVGRLKT